MVKKCPVIINNNYVSVVKYDETKIQFPSIKTNADTVFVQCKDGKYTIVDKPTVSENENKTSMSKKTIKANVTVTEKVESNNE